MKYRLKTISLIFLISFLPVQFCLAILNKGDSFIPFSLKGVDEKTYTVKLEEGNLVVLIEFLKEGKLEVRKSYPDAVLLDFWATWCVPCRAAMPYMQKVYERFQPRAGQEKGGLLLFGIALDQKGSKVVRPFYTKLKITYPMLAEPATALEAAIAIRTTKEMSRNYKVQEIPVVYVIDSKGIIGHSHVGFRKEEIPDLEKAIQGMIAGDQE